MYGPEAFGTLSLFVAVVGIVSVVACLGYELAIMLPSDDRQAASVLWVSLGSALSVGAVAAACMVVARGKLAVWLGAPHLAPYLLLAAPAIFMAGAFAALNAWNSRTRRFGRLSVARVNSSVVTVGIQLGSGFAGWNGGGPLIAASLAGSAVSTSVLGGQIWREDREVLRQGAAPRLMAAAIVAHKKFPIVNTWSALINSVSWQLPSLMLTALFSIKAAGYFSLTFRTLSLPMSLLAASVGQVFFQRAAVANRSGTLSELVPAVFRRLLDYSLFPCVVILIMGPALFSHIFGNQWTEAGIYARILSPWLIIWFVSSPLNNIFSIIGKQELGLLINILLIVTRFLSIFIGWLFGSVKIGLILFSASGALVYGWLCFAILRHSGVRVFALMFKIIPSLLAGTAVSLLLLLMTLISSRLFVAIIVMFVSACGYYYFVIARDAEMRGLWYTLASTAKSRVWGRNA